jgi:hypothetical protein
VQTVVVLLRLGALAAHGFRGGDRSLCLQPAWCAACGLLRDWLVVLERVQGLSWVRGVGMWGQVFGRRVLLLTMMITMMMLTMMMMMMMMMTTTVAVEMTVVLLPRGGTVTSGISVVVSLSRRLVAVHQEQVCVVLRDRQASVRPVLGESTRGFHQ